MRRHVLFIHGTWLTPTIWLPFQSRFMACGYHCSAPAWPPLEQPGLANTGVSALLSYYDQHIRDLPTPPLLIGHGLGGLLVQLLLDRGLGQAAIAIDPVPACDGLNVLPAVRCAWPWVISWFAGRRMLHMTQRQFARTMAQTLEIAEQASAYAHHIVPAPTRVFLDMALGIGERIDFSNHGRAPLLLIAASDDRMVHASTVAAMYRWHRRSVATTTFKQFTGYSHWLIAEPGWEVVADYSIEWAQNQLGRF